MEESVLRRTARDYRDVLLYGVLGAPMGAVVGAVVTVFGKGLQWVTALRLVDPLWFLPFLGLGGVLIVFCYTRFGANSGKGMGLVFLAAEGREEMPLRLVPLAIVSTWVTHLFGGSSGREGVAAQVGAALSYQLGRRLPGRDAQRIFLVAGVAAGFAGLFETPLAAVLFAMELLAAGRLELRALLPSMTAAATACGVSHFFGLEKASYPLAPGPVFSWPLFLELLPLGVLFGLAGLLFSVSLNGAKRLLAARIPSPLLRVLVVGVLLSAALLLLHGGRYSGLGTELVRASVCGGTVYPYDWIAKLILTVLTLSAGFQGGELTPLFSIGATLGALVAPLFGLPTALTAALGYAAVFGSATNTLFAPIFLGCEVFGAAHLPHFFVVCAIANLCNAGRSIYPLQKRLG